MATNGRSRHGPHIANVKFLGKTGCSKTAALAQRAHAIAPSVKFNVGNARGPLPALDSPNRGARSAVQARQDSARPRSAEGGPYPTPASAVTIPVGLEVGRDPSAGSPRFSLNALTIRSSSHGMAQRHHLEDHAPKTSRKSNPGHSKRPKAPGDSGHTARGNRIFVDL